MKAEERDRYLKMAGLVLADALAFQEVLASHLGDPKIPTLAQLLSLAEREDSLARRLQEAWDYILSKDYEPIFDLAKDVLLSIPASPGLERGLRNLLQQAHSIVSSGVLRRHDLMGRLYHRLLFEDTAKSYATYYTSVPAAVLLARLAFATANPSWKSSIPQGPWGDLDWLRQFRVLDMACGSGTLLSAVYNTLRDEYSRLAPSPDPDAVALHQALLEEVLWGFDVLPYAVHLAATALALHNPRAPFVRTRLYSLPLTGQKPVRLGSLDLLERETISLSYFPSQRPIQVGVTAALETEIACPRGDLVIMNPPFTQTKLLFGSFPEGQRVEMREGLNRLLRQSDLSGIRLAGLSAAFVGLTDKYLKPGGRLALVLPRTFLSGIAWRKMRELLADRYEVEYILASHQAPDGWNWSENTDLSEVLVVARQLPEGEEPGNALMVNLWRKPSSTEAIVLSSQIVRATESARIAGRRDLLEDPSSTTESLSLGRKKIGEAYTVSWEALVENLDAWGALMPFAQGELNRMAYLLLSAHALHVPAGGGAFPLPLIPLKDAAEAIGPDRRRIHDAFKPSSDFTPYLAFWGHDASLVTRLLTPPNAFLEVKPGKAQKADTYWDRRGVVMIAEKLRLDTMRMVAVLLSEPALSNMWWPVCFKNSLTEDGKVVTPEEHERIQTVWLNTTLGLFAWLMFRRDTQGAWVELQQEPLSRVTCLNLSQLRSAQVEALIALFEGFKDVELPPFPEQYAQASEGKGGKFELDREILKVLTGHDVDLRPLYRLLAREPILTLQPLA